MTGNVNVFRTQVLQLSTGLPVVWLPLYNTYRLFFIFWKMDTWL
jgi:hypothetical protein